MKFENGTNVVYKNVGVCTVEDVETRSFDGENNVEYYKLRPVSKSSSVYYIPVEKSGEQLRVLFSRDEINSLIDSIKGEAGIWIANSRERRLEFNKILHSDDYKSIIRMTKALYNQQLEKQKHNGHLSSSDEMILTSAENLMFQEFATVLGIERNEVRNYIINRTEQQS